MHFYSVIIYKSRGEMAKDVKKITNEEHNKLFYA